MKLVGGELHVACENSRFFLLLAAFDILQGGTSGTQQQKFHTDDVNQCLHNKSGSPWPGFQMQICSILHFSWAILVKCSFCLRMSSSKTQMLMLEKNILNS